MKEENKIKEPNLTGTEMDKRYDDIQIAMALGKPVSPEDTAFVNSYTKRKEMGPVAYGEARRDVVMSLPMSVYDTNTGNLELLSKAEIDKANEQNRKKGLGSRYIGAELATKIKAKGATFDEIQTSSKQVRDALAQLPGDFSQSQVAKFAQVLKTPDNGSSIRNFLATDYAKSLTPAEINYVTAVKNLKESAFALRSIGGMGQGSDMLREAIAEVVPGERTPTKAYAVSSLDRFDTQVSKLRGGIPGLGAAEQTFNTGTTPNQNPTPPAGFKNTGRTSGGKPVWVSPDGKKYWTP
jgi:hypothetical protein